MQFGGRMLLFTTFPVTHFCSLALPDARGPHHHSRRVPLARVGPLLHLLGLLLLAMQASAGPAGRWAPLGVAPSVTRGISSLLDSSCRAQIGPAMEIAPTRDGALPKLGPPGARCLMFEAGGARGSARVRADG